MKRSLLLIIPTLFVFSYNNSSAQTTWGDSLSLQVEAVAQVSPAQITITWPADADALSFQVYRKSKTATTWGGVMATIAAGTTSYVDATATVGSIYDYKVVMNSTGTPAKYGYLSSGIQVQANSNRGIAIVVIENTYVSNPVYQAAVDQTLMDLELDGWYPKTLYVNASDAVDIIKNNIVSLYSENTVMTKLLLLVGHVPIPHSGDLNPDGHPDHMGAWPTDTYYADMNGSWTDVSINDVTSANIRNHNIPGDGKFDQSYIPTDLELQVGRVDLAELVSFPESEETLLLRYMDKLHRFKIGAITVTDQALIDDNFTTYTEGFSQNGYRNFAPLVGRTNFSTTADYLTQGSYLTGTTGTYIWAFGCGGGWYAGAGGIGSTSNFPPDSLSTVFSMLFGSYFGDWDYSDAFLRAPLAQGNTLTNCWAGRPNWFFHHMAMGENIGYSTRLSQNNSSLYFGSTLAGLTRIVSSNLMGDPSLRMHYIVQPTNLNIVAGGTSNTLNWSAGGAEIGYNVYRRYADSTDFVKLNSSLITGTNFTDLTLPVAGTVYYYVKAVELKTTPSGTYYNESLGVRDSAQTTVSMVETKGDFNLSVYPNPSNGNITVQFNKMDNGTLALYNSFGELVFEKAKLNCLVENINLEVATGVYYLNISNGNELLRRKLIIKK
jgi:Secretion system C-terminal sorting domain